MRFVIQTAAKSAVLLALLLLGACAGTSDYMQNLEPNQVNYAPEADKSLVVFMRPSGLGFAVQSSVFDVTDGSPKFIGILSAKKKIAHYSAPGKRRYMVIGESADFMGATLDPNKVYYALVTPRMGWWKARFSLRPVHAGEISGAEFDEWFKDTQWVENKETAVTWSAQNMNSIREKMGEDLPEWQAKPDKPMLLAADGQSSLYKPSATK